MLIIKIIGIIYLSIGTIYSLYIAVQTPQPVYYLPLNIILGPPVLVYIVIISLKGKRLPVDNPNV